MIYLYSWGDPANLLNCEVRIRERRGMNFLVKVNISWNYNKSTSEKPLMFRGVLNMDLRRWIKFNIVKKFRVITLSKKWRNVVVTYHLKLRKFNQKWKCDSIFTDKILQILSVGIFVFFFNTRFIMYYTILKHYYPPNSVNIYTILRTLQPRNQRSCLASLWNAFWEITMKMCCEIIKAYFQRPLLRR